MALVAKLPPALEDQINTLAQNDDDTQLDRIIATLHNTREIGAPNQQLLEQFKGNLIALIKNVYEFRKYRITGDVRRTFDIVNGLNLNDFVFTINELCKVLDFLFSTNINIRPLDYKDELATETTLRRINTITTLLDSINEMNIHNIHTEFIARKIDDEYSFHKYKHPIGKNDKIFTFLDTLNGLYYTLVLPFYNKYYLDNTPISIRTQGTRDKFTDFKPQVYKIYYSLLTLIKLVAEQRSDVQNISQLNSLITPNSDPEILQEPVTPKDKIAAIENYNSLTKFYNKYIGTYAKKYPGLEDNVDIIYTRSHFYPAIETMYKSLPTVGTFGFITRDRGVPGPTKGGGLRYARRRQN